MGSSFVNFRGFIFAARDGHLELWLRALARAIDELESAPQWLREARDHWHLQGSGYFTGFISPHLDEIAGNESRRETVRNVSRTAAERLRAEGELLSREYLDWVYCEDFGAPLPAVAFVDVAEKWLRLLEDDCVADSGDAWGRIEDWRDRE